ARSRIHRCGRAPAVDTRSPRRLHADRRRGGGLRRSALSGRNRTRPPTRRLDRTPPSHSGDHQRHANAARGTGMHRPDAMKSPTITTDGTSTLGGRAGTILQLLASMLVTVVLLGVIELVAARYVQHLKQSAGAPATPEDAVTQTLTWLDANPAPLAP